MPTSADRNINLAYLASISGIGILSGFALALSKFKINFQGNQNNLQGFRLGLNALGIASAINILTIGGSVYIIKKVFDINSFDALKAKAGHILPKISQGKSGQTTLDAIFK